METKALIGWSTTAKLIRYGLVEFFPLEILGPAEELGEFSSMEKF